MQGFFSPEIQLVFSQEGQLLLLQPGKHYMAQGIPSKITFGQFQVEGKRFFKNMSECIQEVRWKLIQA